MVAVLCLYGSTPVAHIVLSSFKVDSIQSILEVGMFGECSVVLDLSRYFVQKIHPRTRYTINVVIKFQTQLPNLNTLGPWKVT